jgi:type VI secretion system protein ImpL
MIELKRTLTKYLERPRRRRAAAQLAGVLTASDQGDIYDAFKRAKMADAISSIERSWGGKTYLCDVPVYVLIGPAGTGTALLVSKLGLHVAVRIEGVASSDWWFAREAILVDSADRWGEFRSRRNQKWLAVLDALKAARPERPVSGAIVTFSFDDLMMSDIAPRANEIRYHLSELQLRLGIRLLVHFVFTKCDLIAGLLNTFPILPSRGGNSPGVCDAQPTVKPRIRSIAFRGALSGWPRACVVR